MRQFVLPDFPWDQLAPYGDKAAQHPDGIIDLSIGTPVDDTPQVVQDALTAGANAPGYPQTVGTPALREAIVSWLQRVHGITGVTTEMVLPVIGSKEFVGGLPTLLGLGAGDAIVIPELAYPTYAVSAAYCGAEVLARDGLAAIGPQRVSLIWINSPSNPTGKVLPETHLRKVVDEARSRGAIVASDECYLDLSYDGPKPQSVLHPDVCGGSFEGLLAVHSLSKRSNFAGYRGGFVAGDPALIKRLTEVRKHLGYLVPRPVQDAMAAAYTDDEHVEVQRQRYAARRTVLKGALEAAGFTIDESEAGLYLWATRGLNCWDTVDLLADKGILVAPGAFYGPKGAQHVRVALTASDDAITQAAARLNA